MATQKHIVVIRKENHCDIAISLILRNAGYKISYASPPLNNSNLGRADLVLLDIEKYLPKVQELNEELERLKSPRMPILFISSCGDRQIVRGLQYKGYVEYIQKPFGPNELLKRIAFTIAAKPNTNELVSNEK